MDPELAAEFVERPNLDNLSNFSVFLGLLKAFETNCSGGNNLDIILQPYKDKVLT